MRYKELGKSGLKVSVVAQGSWEMAGNVWGCRQDDESVRAIRAAVENGINLIDTAASYGGGKSEEVVGVAIQGIRDKVLVATKCGATFNPAKNALDMDLTPKGIRREIEASLRRLQTDYIDVYQFHYPDPNTPICDSLGEMVRLKEEGKIRAIGLSNFDQVGLEEALQYAQIDSLQAKCSLLDRKNDELIAYCAEKGVGVITYGSIAGGMLTGKYKEVPTFGEGDRRKFFYPYLDEPLFTPARKLVDVLEEIAGENEIATVDVAINWVTNLTGVTTSLVGGSSVKHATHNALSGGIVLDPKYIDRINEAYDAIYKNN